MKKLQSDWFVEGLQDFEYKKYILLAYLKWVRSSFSEAHLYPAFGDLMAHYRNIQRFQMEKQGLSSRFSQELTGVDWKRMELVYDSLVNDDEALKELESLLEYAIPRMESHLEEGKVLFDLIHENLEIEEVGLMPLYRDEGYLLLHQESEQAVSAYVYKVSVFQHAEDRYRGLHTDLVGRFTYSLASTLSGIKRELVRTHQMFPNPATFAVRSRLGFPEEQSLMPVAKRLFLRYLYANNL